MSKADKLKEKLRSGTDSITWSDVETLLDSLGFKKKEGSGSRVKFIRKDGGYINLHKPHPGNELKKYAVKQLREMLEAEGLL